jgi:hypothetical protein
MNKACVVLLTVVMTLMLSAITDANDTPEHRQPKIRRSLKQDTSPPLREIQPSPPTESPAIREIPMYRRPPRGQPADQEKEGESGGTAIQDWHASIQIPAPIQSFEGISNADNQAVVGGQVVPPDPNGDVGPNHYVQIVNFSLAVYNKTGTRLVGPLPNNALWSGFGGLCETTNNGDPIVLYDHLADRWFLSQFAFDFDANGNPVGPFFQCIAISQTGDPTGAYFRYAFQMPVDKLNDYPKFGVWPDAYYMSVNQFVVNPEDFVGVGVAAFERDKMLIGQPAQLVYFDLDSVDPNFFGLLPADLDGPPPPTGSPNFFVAFAEAPNDLLNLWEFHVDFSNPANSTFGVGGQANAVLNTDPFNSNFGRLCAPPRLQQLCVPQPGSILRRVDAVADRLMFRLQYRNFGTHQSLVTNHTVNLGSGLFPRAAIRWYELRNSGSGWSLFQQGTYSPDSDHRWMGSAAMDSGGNIAIGFSTSGPAIFPSIRYAGRLATDPPGELSQGEAELITGGGVQTSPLRRWGDYSMMAVDPTDDCTFWYTQEYYATSSEVGWQTRIGSFKFPSCGAP